MISKLTKYLGIPLILLAGLLTFAPASVAAHAPVVRTYTFWYSPGWYGWYGYGPRWWGMPYPYPAYVNAGRVKIVTHMKDAQVYVDGGYAGPASKLKKFPLRSGNHDIEVRDSDGREVYQARVQVIVGKTLEIRV